MGGVVLRKFVEGTEKYVVRAKAMTGQEKGQMHLAGVEVTFPYLAQGKRGTGIVTADACVYDPDRQRASFRGNVKVTGEKASSSRRTRSSTRETRGGPAPTIPSSSVAARSTGESTGAEYRSEEEALDLPKDVRLRVEREGFPPTDIEAGRAEIRRRESAVRFFGAVKVTRGAEYLESDELNLEMSADFEKIDRAVAIEGVVRAGGGDDSRGREDSGGWRRLARAPLPEARHVVPRERPAPRRDRGQERGAGARPRRGGASGDPPRAGAPSDVPLRRGGAARSAGGRAQRFLELGARARHPGGARSAP